MDIPRPQIKHILDDLEKKIVFITGPRQVGKTWIAKKVMESFEQPLYLNFDEGEHRKLIKARAFPAGLDLIVFDELHKMRGWKNYLKGLFDTKREGLRILVIGSARLNSYRRVGDSLAGRYLLHRVLPLSLAEIKDTHFKGDMARLLSRGGFPEHFIESEVMDERLRRLYVESMINVDALDFAAMQDIRALHAIFSLLRERVGSPLSYKGLAEDVGISPKTAKRYVSILEDLYLIFLVRPYTHKIARAIRKEPKAYFFDVDMVHGDEGKKLENLVALSLLKEDYFLEDTTGTERGLSYVRNKQGNEVDFVRTEHDRATTLVEVKWSEGAGTRQLKYFTDRYPIPAIQIVGHTSHKELDYGAIRIVRAKEYLEQLAI